MVTIMMALGIALKIVQILPLYSIHIIITATRAENLRCMIRTGEIVFSNVRAIHQPLIPIAFAGNAAP